MRVSLMAAVALVLGAGAGWRGEGQAAKDVQRESAFACDRRALDAAARHRHFDVLGPALAAAHKTVRELPDGFDFAFAANPTTLQQMMDWVAGERLCCPFFDIEIRIEREGGPMHLRLTGREGAKQFVKGDFARWMHS